MFTYKFLYFVKMHFYSEFIKHCELQKYRGNTFHVSSSHSHFSFLFLYLSVFLYIYQKLRSYGQFVLVLLFIAGYLKGPKKYNKNSYIILLLYLLANNRMRNFDYFFLRLHQKISFCDIFLYIFSNRNSANVIKIKCEAQVLDL